MMKVTGLLPRALALCVLCGRGAAAALLQGGRRRQQLHQASSNALHFVLPYRPPPSTRPPSMLRFTTATASCSTTRRFSSSSSSSSSQPPHLSTPPPPLLDKSLFNETRQVQALRLPAAHCHEAIQSLAPYLFRTTGQRSVVLPGECKLALTPPLGPDERLLLFSLPSTEQYDTDGDESITKQQHEEEQQKLTALLHSLSSASLLPSPGYPVQLTYADLSLFQALRRLLPPSLAVPSSFETVGHLAHLNLRPEALPYKHLIAQVIIDKNSKRIKTVVNKIGEIENTFRVLPLEVIGGEAGREGGREGGEGGTFVKVKESGAWFAFDFSEVYWNSRLQGEHGRVIEVVCEGGREGGPRRSGIAMKNEKKDKEEQQQQQQTGLKEHKSATTGKNKEKQQHQKQQHQKEQVVVWDVFAGVGPFSIPLAMRGYYVYANDLNDRSYHYLCLNAQANKVPLPPSLLPPSPSSPSITTASSKNIAAASCPPSSSTTTNKKPPPSPAAAAAAAAAATTTAATASTAGFLHPRNQDGRAFLRDLALNQIPVNHIIMNLPAIALEFLDVFAEEEGGREGGKEEGREGGRKGLLFGYLRGKGVMVHVYAFSKAEDAERDVVARAAAVMGVEVGRFEGGSEGGREGGRVRVHHVRDVAPKKRMMCLSFSLEVVLGE